MNAGEGTLLSRYVFDDGGMKGVGIPRFAQDSETSSDIFHSGKQIRLHLCFARRGGVGQMKHLHVAALADSLFKKAKERRLRGVALEGGNLYVNFALLQIDDGRGRCQ